MADMLKNQAREDENAALACLACIAECILSMLAGIMEYINRWAYVYVGIYGYDFRTSGKAVMDLFRNRGWTAVINDDLTSSALGFGALGVGASLSSGREQRLLDGVVLMRCWLEQAWSRAALGCWSRTSLRTRGLPRSARRGRRTVRPCQSSVCLSL